MIFICGNDEDYSTIFNTVAASVYCIYLELLLSLFVCTEVK